MPNRILKESICESRGLSEVSFFAEDLYKRLITYADDYGRFNADFQIILARLYPREIGIVSLDDIEDAMTELVGAGKITFYTAEARKEIYGCFPNWAEHQRVRDSKRKMPVPSDTSVNDWYLKRFIPKDLKRRIIERDKMKCCECGKYICAESSSADRVIKFCAGMYHIDHIVPVEQGGRATEENLRLLCPRCNLTRKKKFTFEEILSFTQSAATRCNSPQLAATRGLNPIQSESESESNPKQTGASPDLDKDAMFKRFWDAYPRKTNKDSARKAFMKLNPTDETLSMLLSAIEQQESSDQWQDQRFIPHAATWLNGKRWEDKLPAARAKSTHQSAYTQREYDEDPTAVPEWLQQRMNNQ